MKSLRISPLSLLALLLIGACNNNDAELAKAEAERAKMEVEVAKAKADAAKARAEGAEAEVRAKQQAEESQRIAEVRQQKAEEERLAAEKLANEREAARELSVPVTLSVKLPEKMADGRPWDSFGYPDIKIVAESGTNKAEAESKDTFTLTKSLGTWKMKRGATVSFGVYEADFPNGLETVGHSKVTFTGPSTSLSATAGVATVTISFGAES